MRSFNRLASGPAVMALTLTLLGSVSASDMPAATAPAGDAEVLYGGRFFYAANYGEFLPAASQQAAVWWCDATRKVPRLRALPTTHGTAVRMTAARNEFEAAQIVVCPREPMTGLTAKASPFAGPGGATIPTERIQLLRVAYVRASVPTDKLGLADEWPDPLPPFDAPIDVEANRNQPLWLVVHVPADAAPGLYRGSVTLSAKGFTATVPVELHVWDFALPDRPFTQSGFGLGVGRIAQYHGLKTEQDKRTVFAKYLQSFADHRISPYDPVPFDPIVYRFHPDSDPPRCDVDFSKFDAAMEEAVRKYRVTSFMLHVPGMGSGTFHARHEGELQGHKAGSPKYEAMMSSMLGQLQGHLEKKGWIDLAYVYWFDEPDPKDYAFVRDGMERLKKYAPKLRRLLTEEPVKELFDTVSLWCPLSLHFKPEDARPRMALGEQFWWYVCCGPRQPFCTLFIDHPATSLRTWLWQTWQRDISGILIWETVYWTSKTAFPNSLQNPYEDAMAYQTGYGQAEGTKGYWGNGDGRFLYPPLAAAGGSDTPIPDAPVSSIRWEMLREGIEDVDYLHLLKAAIATAKPGTDAAVLDEARALLKVSPDITSDVKVYAFDARPIYAQRRRVAEMIERLGRQ